MWKKESSRRKYFFHAPPRLLFSSESEHLTVHCLHYGPSTFPCKVSYPLVLSHKCSFFLLLANIVRPHSDRLVACVKIKHSFAFIWKGVCSVTQLGRRGKVAQARILLQHDFTWHWVTEFLLFTSKPSIPELESVSVGDINHCVVFWLVIVL